MTFAPVVNAPSGTKPTTRDRRGMLTDMYRRRPGAYAGRPAAGSPAPQAPSQLDIARGGTEAADIVRAKRAMQPQIGQGPPQQGEQFPTPYSAPQQPGNTSNWGNTLLNPGGNTTGQEYTKQMPASQNNGGGGFWEGSSRQPSGPVETLNPYAPNPQNAGSPVAGGPQIGQGPPQRGLDPTTYGVPGGFMQNPQHTMAPPPPPPPMQTDKPGQGYSRPMQPQYGQQQYAPQASVWDRPQQPQQQYQPQQQPWTGPSNWTGQPPPEQGAQYRDEARRQWEQGRAQQAAQYGSPGGQPPSQPQWAAQQGTPQQGRVADVDYGAPRNMPQMQSGMQAGMQRRATIPMFAYGTGQGAYQQAGMGGSWIPTSNNQYAQGKQIPPMMQQLINQGMPIPPALLNSVTGGQSGPLNMAAAFTARGGGSLPSSQGYGNMSLDEREAFGGYLTGPIGMPEASTMESIGRPTSNLQRAAVSRI